MKTHVHIALLLCFVLIVSSCDSSQKSDIVYEEIWNVKATDQLKTYLELIFDTDQNGTLEYGYIPRQLQIPVSLDGYESFTHHELNVERIRQIYQYFDFPTEQEYGEKAYTPMWMVLHHDLDTLTTQEFLPILREHHHLGNIDITNYLWYLKRRYQYKTGDNQHYKIEGISNDSIELAQVRELEKELF